MALFADAVVEKREIHKSARFTKARIAEKAVIMPREELAGA